MAPLGRGSKETLKRVKPRATGRAGIEGVEGATGAQSTQRINGREKGDPGFLGPQEPREGSFRGDDGHGVQRQHQRMQNRKRPRTWKVILRQSGGGGGGASWQWVKEDALFCKLGDDGKY